MSQRLRDLLAVGLAIVAVSLFALWRMGYLDAATAHHARLTDNTRTAYVAKNLVDGHGYTTNDLPAALLDFYDHEGRLDDARWENADRFPFTAYAIAGLYTVTGSTSYAVGITLYNFLTFVGYLLVVFALTRAVWNDRGAALVAVALALAHPYSYLFLYLKDADTQLLSAAFFLTLHRFLGAPAHTSSRKLQLWLGTVLAWVFLARPNVGAAFVLVIAFLGARQALRDRRTDGLGFALRRLARGYGLAAAAMIVWCLPFAIDTMREWGAPFFSANNIYQLPLGTRYGMGTDTWWKYTEPGHPISLGQMWRLAPDDMRAKLTTSWLATLQWVLRSYAVELLAAVGALVWARRRATATHADAADADAPPTDRRFATLLGAAGFAAIFNLAVLPLYAYKNYAFIHYLSFALPMIWCGAGFAAMACLRQIALAWPRVVEHARAHRAIYTAAIILAALLWGLGATGALTNPWFIRPGRLASKHWLFSLLTLAVLIGHRRLWRPVTFERGLVIAMIIVLARYRADVSVMRTQLVFFPTTDHPAQVLRERTGVVSSLALQAEVAWMSGRKNVPVPEYALHLYSYAFDHHLTVEDVYLESAEAMITPGVGAFALAAPGFETYARMQRYGGTFPGYTRVLHETATRRYTPKQVIPKASSIYRLTDPAAVARMADSPSTIELGRLDAIVHTAYGFDRYVATGGRDAVVTTDAIARRYLNWSEAPSEDVGVTYFIGDHEPRAIDLAVYGTGPGTVRVYQNVDLFFYTRPRDLPGHLVATVELTGAGWQTVRVELPPGHARRGLNKLGFIPDHYYPTILCPAVLTDELCARTPLAALPSGEPDPAAPHIIRTDGGEAVAVRSAMLLGTMSFVY